MIHTHKEIHEIIKPTLPLQTISAIFIKLYSEPRYNHTFLKVWKKRIKNKAIILISSYILRRNGQTNCCIRWLADVCLLELSCKILATQIKYQNSL